MVTKNAVVVEQAQDRVPMAEPEGGWPADEFTGEPGHFVRDPYTGVRSRATVAEVVTQVAGFDGVASAADVQ